MLPILLISPTDNALKPLKIKEIVTWIKESALLNNVAFFNLYESTGGAGYFKKSMKKKEANTDGVHFLKSGYEVQAEKIWKASIRLNRVFRFQINTTNRIFLYKEDADGDR